MTLIAQINHALEAADEIQKDIGAEEVNLLNENLRDISYVMPNNKYNLPYNDIGMMQCENICYAQDKNVVDECNAFCYAHYAMKNSALNDTGPAHTCYKSISAHVYDNKFCSIGTWIQDESEKLQARLKEDIDINKCRTHGQDWHRYVCDESSLRHTVFTDDDCSEAYLTYKYQWHTCVEYDSERGLYVYLKSALALKTSIIGASLALFASQFWGNKECSVIAT